MTFYSTHTRWCVPSLLFVLQPQQHHFSTSYFICEQQSLQVKTLVELRGVYCPRKLSASTSFLGVLGVMRSILGVLGVMKSVLGVLGVMGALGAFCIVVSLTTKIITPNIQLNQYQVSCSTKNRWVGISEHATIYSDLQTAGKQHLLIISTTTLLGLFWVTQHVLGESPIIFTSLYMMAAGTRLWEWGDKEWRSRCLRPNLHRRTFFSISKIFINIRNNACTSWSRQQRNF